MAARGRKAVFVVVAVVLGFGLVTLAAPASAQSIFERIFGGLRHAVEAPRAPTNIHAFVDPFTALANHFNPPPQQRAEFNPGKGYCVRTCDGHFFPVQGHAGLSAAESCHSFCPASQTRLYSGGTIDGAVASDGSRYADMDNAFVYRKQLVGGCTCNGRDPFGLARMDVNNDPTLRPGDVVATKSGLMAFTGIKDKVADFTPIDAYRGMSQSARDKLSDVKIMPPNPGAAETTAATVPTAADRPRDRRQGAQASR